jgi:glutaredoxin
MNSPLTVTLYYANWCGHCVPAKAAWAELENKLKNMNYQYKNVGISLEKYEADQMQANNQIATINGKEIPGYPTIKFGVNCNGEFKEYEYNDQRDANVILNYIKRMSGEIVKCQSRNRRGSQNKRGSRGRKN